MALIETPIMLEKRDIRQKEIVYDPEEIAKHRSGVICEKRARSESFFPLDEAAAGKDEEERENSSSQPPGSDLAFLIARRRRAADSPTSTTLLLLMLMLLLLPAPPPSICRVRGVSRSVAVVIPGDNRGEEVLEEIPTPSPARREEFPPSTKIR